MIKICHSKLVSLQVLDCSRFLIAYPRNALVRRFDHHPGIYYLRQCVIPGWEGRPKMILEQLCQLLRGSRISEEQLRMIAARLRSSCVFCSDGPL